MLLKHKIIIRFLLDEINVPSGLADVFKLSDDDTASCLKKLEEKDEALLHNLTPLDYAASLIDRLQDGKNRVHDSHYTVNQLEKSPPVRDYESQIKQRQEVYDLLGAHRARFSINRVF